MAIALSIGATTNRTCRLRNATPEKLRHLIRLNLEGLREVLRFNLQQGIYLYRISSQIIPFASHPVNRLPWWDEFAGLLAELGAFIARHSFRVSMHPGQFTVLNSPNPDVVEASVLELQWHVRLLESLRTDSSHKIVLHVGGAYGAREEAIDRFVRTVGALPGSWRRRLVLENDERVFTAEEVLEVSGRTGLPVVFDWLHHQANPGSTGNAAELIRRCFDSWRAPDGLPKVHLSSQKPRGRPGQHADWVEPQDFLNLLEYAPERPFDCMLEAKGKELALLKLRRQLRERGIVEAAA